MMNSKVNSILVFSFGVIIGSLITWKLVKTKYERIAQAEIDSVKEVFSKRKTEESSDKNEEEPKEEEKIIPKLSEKPSLAEYAKLLNKEGYTDYSKKEEKGGSIMDGEPYVITPDDFGDVPGYDTESLVYYADGVVTDTFSNVIDNVDDIIGEDSLTHFGEYEDDSVFVRNDALKTDYEILLDTRNFSDVKPTLSGDEE